MNSIRMKIFTYVFILFLFLSSSFLLFFRLGSYPNGLYNWENYTIWRIYQRQNAELTPPIDNYLYITQGLMTDSGLSPFLVIPIEIISNNFGMNLFTLRAWSAFVGVITVLAFFFFTNKMFGVKVASFASVYLLFAPSFLTYMRTGTNVGISLLPSIITIYLIYKVWKKKHIITSSFLLIALLAINSYFYAPIRFLLILSIFILVPRLLYLKLAFIRKLHKGLLASLLLIFCVSIGLFFLSNTSLTTSYFHGRGEQIVTMYGERPDLKERGANALITLLSDNVTSLVKIYLDIGTTPSIVDFWNPKGQIINIFLVPFLLIGIFVALRKIKKINYLLLLLWFVFTTAPIILTNNVHIGRLFFSLAPMFIFVGIGIERVLHLLKFVFRFKIAYLPLVIAVAFSLYWQVKPYYQDILTLDNFVSADTLKSAGIENSDVYLFNPDGESLKFWIAYFYLRDIYKFENLKDVNRELVGNKDSNFKAYFLETNATSEDIFKYCNQNSLPVILVGANQQNIGFACRNKLLQI